MNYKLEKWLLFFSSDQPRRPAVIKQLLDNHLTTSALFWGKAYGLIDLISVPLVTTDFNAEIEWLHQQKYLIKADKGSFLTEAGKKEVEKLKTSRASFLEPSFFNGFDHKGFEKQLYLLIQVVSELSYANKKYFVITNDLKAQQLTKKLLKSYGKEKLRLAVKESLENFLETNDPFKALLFSQTLTGHQYLGKTKEQLAREHDLAPEEVYIIQKDMLARYAAYLLKHSPELAPLVAYYKRQTILPKSVKITYQLFLEGNSLKQIERIRGLKPSTIQEHLLDCALLLKDMDKEKLLAREKRQAINQFFGKKDVLEWNFNALKAVMHEATFFEYRLTQIERIESRGT